jgi:hypothetical protein
MGSFRFGLEAGLAGRFGGHPNAEFWGGVVGRYDVWHQLCHAYPGGTGA